MEPKAEITKLAFILNVCSLSSIHEPSSNWKKKIRRRRLEEEEEEEKEEEEEGEGEEEDEDEDEDKDEEVSYAPRY